MKAYVGQTRSSTLIPRLIDLGYGEMTQPREVPPRRRPFALDNAAFTAWSKARKAAEKGKRARPWSGPDFESACRELHASGIAPDFVVVPDRVAAGVESLDFSLAWSPWVRGFAPLYLAVQDGMDLSHVSRVISTFDGLFVGGTNPWKYASAPYWVQLAHSVGRPCHIGRVSSATRVKWARKIGADSIDSCVPLFAERNLRNFHRGLTEPL